MTTGQLATAGRRSERFVRQRIIASLWWVLSMLFIFGGPVAWAAVSVSNVRAAQRAGTKLVDIDYDVAGATASVAVNLQVSPDGGATWNVPVTSATGAIGNSVTAGNNLRITWNAGVDWNGQYSTQMRFRVAVDDLADFVRVDEGTLPPFSQLGAMAVSTFYIGKYEVRWGEFQTARTWASANGYDIGSVGFANGSNYPVTNVNWYQAMKWCNARSEMESRTPVYTVGGSVYRTGSQVPVVSASANGYRLPSEKEWEWAARGGTQTHGYTYSGSNDISAVTWYWSNAGAVTHAAGMKGANELGTYDMSGNVYEWCFDVYSGTSRVLRGGSWRSNTDIYFGDSAGRCAVGSRTNNADPIISGDDIGFRLALSSVSVSSDSANTVVDSRNPVVITAQPLDRMVNPGDPVSFSVTATGTEQLTYQWKKGTVNISGATSATYTIGSAAESDEGSYSVAVTNAVGSVTSSAAALSVSDSVVITSQPVSVGVMPGATASFTVAATGTGTMTYQWKKSGASITGATSATYSIANAAVANEGTYTCAVTNLVGTVLSSGAVLSVGPTITAQPVGQTVSPGVAVTLSVTATGTALTYQWKKGGVDITGATSASYAIASVTEGDEGSYTVLVSNAGGSVTSSAAALSVNDPVVITSQPVSVGVMPGATASFTVAATGTGTMTYQWEKNGTNITGATSATYSIANAAVANEGTYTCAVTNLVGTVLSSGAVLSVGPTITAQPVGQTVSPDVAVTLSVTATGTALTYQWKKGGVDITGATSASYAVASVTEGHEGSYTVVVSNAGGSVTSSVAVLSVNDPVVITGQPVGATVNPGKQASFNVTATGTGPLTYQWKKGSSNIEGATTATYTIPQAAESDEGNYSVVVTNIAGDVTSSVAVLSVNDPVVITAQPSPRMAMPGGSATFTVTAGGTGPHTYQWKRNDADIVGETASVLALTNISSADMGTYSCAVTNSTGTAVSNGALLTVGPAITVQPAGGAVNPGGAKTLSVVATGTAPFTYQWRKGGQPIPNANGPNHTISPATDTAPGAYDVVVTNAAGSVTSDSATLSLNEGVVISGQPAGQLLKPGATLNLSVTATGTGPLTYQWRKNATEIAGATQAELRIDDAQAADSATYDVVVSNVVGSVTSRAAKVVVAQGGAVAFAAATGDRIKPAGEIRVPVVVRRTGTPTGPASVQVALGTGSLSTEKFSLVERSVEWVDGDGTDKVVNLVLKPSVAIASGGDTVELLLQGATGAGLGDVASTLLTFRPLQAGALLFSVASVEKVKPATGDLAFEVSVSRTQGSTGAVSVDAVVTGGTALAADYTIAKPVRLTWEDGDASEKSFPVAYKGAVPAAGKTIVLKLQNVTGGALIGGMDTATLAIRSATVPGTVAFAGAAQLAAKPQQGELAIPVTLRRTMGANGTVSVQVAASGGNASGTDDYSLPSNKVVTWGDGDMEDKTFTVTLKGGAQIASAGETIALKLQTPTGGAVLGTAATTITVLSSAALPTVTIATPAAAATLTGAGVVVQGAASDENGLSKVEVRLNDGTPVEATLTEVGSRTKVNWMLSLVPEQGVNTIKVIAVDAAGNRSAEAARTFTFVYVREYLAGTYDGLLEPETTAAQLAVEHPGLPLVAAAFARTKGWGLSHIVVTNTGSFTGKLTTADVAVPFKGVLKKDGTALFDSKNPALEIAKGTGATKVVLGSLTLRANESGELPVIVGELTHQAGTVLLASVVAQKAVYSAATVLPAGMRRVPTTVANPATDKGAYTGLFDSRKDAGLETNGGLATTAFPQASGYTKMTVSTAGIVTFVGRLADGSVVSYSNRLAPDSTLALYLPLYTNRGFLAGTVGFDSTDAASDAAADAMTWVRPAGLASPYVAGWPEGITVDFVASKYVTPTTPTKTVPVPANPYSVLGAALPLNSVTTDAIPDFLTLNLALSGGSLTQGAGNVVKLAAANVVTILGAASGSQAAVGLKLAFVTADGTFSGSFTHPVSKKAVTFAGVVLQKQRCASGFFTFTPPTPVGAATTVGTVDVVVP